jgi:hypothetical protein
MAVNHRLINDSNGSVLLSSWRTVNMLAHLKLCHPNTVAPTKYVFKEKFCCIFPQHTYIEDESPSISRSAVLDACSLYVRRRVDGISADLIDPVRSSPDTSTLDFSKPLAHSVISGNSEARKVLPIPLDIMLSPMGREVGQAVGFWP